MQSGNSIYLGRILNDLERKNFRVYVYDAEGAQKLVNSWDEFQRYMDEGRWFASRKDALNFKKAVDEKPQEKKVEFKFKKK